MVTTSAFTQPAVPQRAAASPRPTRQPQRNVSHGDLRQANLALVLQSVLRHPRGISRAEVAQDTGLTRATVSRLADELVGSGLVRLSDSVVGKQGRPSSPITVTDTVCALGLQVNATFLAARLIGLDGTTIGEAIRSANFVGSDPHTVLDGLGELARSLLDERLGGRRLIGAGLALPGAVSAWTGILLRAPNLGWVDIDPGEHLDLGYPDLPLLLGNEADFSALGLAHAAPGQTADIHTFIYVSGEIGIGGSAVFHGEPLGGVHGWAGEIGHVCVDPAGPECPCGSRGCLERFAGLRALTNRSGLGASSTAADILAAWRAGEPRTVAALAIAADALETALVSALNLLDIPTVYLGGHLGELAPALIPTVEAGLRRRVLARRGTEISLAADPRLAAGQAMGPAATGAALRVLDSIVKDPASLNVGSASSATPNPQGDFS